ncbi:SPE_1075/MLC_0560 family membrane protein [Spiroplasma endosymbiont of Cantharis rufa]|uniref:SPE_1075/MLC_0560 family membrane protein n=1 Tax=Spiroplasma endosymbiont of Cantharis rufa TaxID=3066279 RepID=UPI0030CED750
MKNLFNENMKSFSKNWKAIIVKFILLILGILLTAFGLALYQQPSVGGSQIDWLIYNVLSISIPFVKEGKVGQGVYDNYAISLTTLYIVLILFAICFSIKPTIDEYKKTKSKSAWFKFSWFILADIIITFIVPQIVGLFITPLSQMGIRELIPGARNLIFIAGFLCFVLGIAFWVKSGWLLGPFNNICEQFLRLTKMSYSKSRLIIDISILIIAFAFFPFVKGEEASKTDFLLTNFGLGTICFTFLVGPLVNQILIILDKVFDYKKMNNKENIVVNKEL